MTEIEREISSSPVLMTEKAVTERFHQLAEEAASRRMARFRRENGLAEFLEMMENETDWRLVRACLNTLDVFAPQLADAERELALDTLVRMLGNRNGAVRRRAGRTAGRILAGSGKQFDRKWKEMLHSMLFPGSGVTERRRRWIGYAMKFVFSSLLEETEGVRRRSALAAYAGYFKSADWDTITCLSLINGIIEIPHSEWSSIQQKLIFDFARKLLTRGDTENRTAALWLLDAWLDEGWKPSDEAAEVMRGFSVQETDAVSCRYLTDRIRRTAGSDGSAAVFSLDAVDPQALIMENHRYENSWVHKIIYFAILRELAIGGDTSGKLDVHQYASHLLNMLRFSNQAVVRLRAGHYLVEAVPHLTAWQQREIAEELLRAVQMGEEDNSNYYPSVLAAVLLEMDPAEQKEILPQFREILETAGDEAVRTILDTAAVTLQMLDSGEQHEKLLHEMAGILCSGMASCDRKIAREALFLAGFHIFADRTMQPEMKNRCMALLGRKMLIFGAEACAGGSDSLDGIWVQMSRYITVCAPERHHTSEHQKIAVFSGTFNPFTQGHRAAAKAAAAMGYRVYINAHEFSWRQKVQPAGIRRRILAMSIADLEDVYLLPGDLPVNIDSPEDLQKLRSLFAGHEVWLMCGSDVPLNRAAYLRDPLPGDVHSFPHIIFMRTSEEQMADPEELRARVGGETLFLQLPSRYDRLTSRTLVQNIEEGRDISDFVDGQVRRVIREHNLYSGEVLFRRDARTKKITTQLLKNPDSSLPEQALPELRERVRALLPADALTVILDEEQDGPCICGAVSLRALGLTDLFDICHDRALTEALRARVSGKVVEIRGIAGIRTETADTALTALTEALAICQEKAYSWAVCLSGAQYDAVLRAHGFLPLPGFPDCYLVDLARPTVVFYDSYSYLREPYAGDASVRRALWEGRCRLQESVTALFPGQLVLNLDTDILNYRFAEMLREEHADTAEKMCVPFGKIFKGAVFPDTVTKELCSEKVYTPDLTSFEIREFPHYAPLRTQIRTIHSFHMPVILVDDVYHNGYRTDKIDPILKEEKIDVCGILVGVISGRGCDLMKEKGEDIRAAYTVPNLRCWIMASDLYPFVGGDSVARDAAAEVESDADFTALPSVNQILPYQIPAYLKGAPKAEVYRLSCICLENAKQIFSALETAYEKRTHRKLTVARLGEVMAEPRYPDGTVTCPEDSTLRVTELIGRDETRLLRMRSLAEM